MTSQTESTRMQVVLTAWQWTWLKRQMRAKKFPIPKAAHVTTRYGRCVDLVIEQSYLDRIIVEIVEPKLTPGSAAHDLLFPLQSALPFV